MGPNRKTRQSPFQKITGRVGEGTVLEQLMESPQGGEGAMGVCQVQEQGEAACCHTSFGRAAIWFRA
jgi:hypothetical protein